MPAPNGVTSVSTHVAGSPAAVLLLDGPPRAVGVPDCRFFGDEEGRR